jgi:hypothetical protein
MEVTDTCYYGSPVLLRTAAAGADGNSGPPPAVRFYVQISLTGTWGSGTVTARARQVSR